jgi:uncharacterized protein (TIGR02246 family)
VSVRAETPADVDRLFAEAISRGDLEGAVEQYEDDAQYVDGDGSIAQGRAAIREALRELLTSKPTLDCYQIDVTQNGDLAVLRARWTFVGTRPDGSRIDTRGRSIEVVRRQPAGTWHITIDLPNGAS